MRRMGSLCFLYGTSGEAGFGPQGKTLGSYLPFSVPTLGQLRGSTDLRGTLRTS